MRLGQDLVIEFSCHKSPFVLYPFFLMKIDVIISFLHVASQNLIDFGHRLMAISIIIDIIIIIVRQSQDILSLKTNPFHLCHHHHYNS